MDIFIATVAHIFNIFLNQFSLCFNLRQRRAKSVMIFWLDFFWYTNLQHNRYWDNLFQLYNLGGNFVK